LRTHVSFRHPAEFVPISDEDGILSTTGADWFVKLLERIPGLEIDRDLCQEDWGVVVFAERDGMKFWIGIGGPYNEEGQWLILLNHGSFAWLQRFRKSGREALQQLAIDFHQVLTGDPAVSKIQWYEPRETQKAEPVGHTTPTSLPGPPNPRP
jgi:hypothetical protein